METYLGYSLTSQQWIAACEKLGGGVDCSGERDG